ncbi:hypothetical protein Bca4012_043183 [Brassica carinata]
MQHQDTKPGTINPVELQKTHHSPIPRSTYVMKVVQGRKLKSTVARQRSQDPEKERTKVRKEPYIEGEKG